MIVGRIVIRSFGALFVGKLCHLLNPQILRIKKHHSVEIETSNMSFESWVKQIALKVVSLKHPNNI